jgi:predicted RNase H-like nuclease
VASLSALKRHEDALDALVCCWVGASFMAGKVSVAKLPDGVLVFGGRGN